MYVVLILGLLALAVFTYRFFNRDVLSPSFLLTLSFLLSGVAAFVAKIFGLWNDVELGPFVCFIVIVGLLATIVGEYLTRRFFNKKEKKKVEKKTSAKVIKVNWVKILLCYMFVVASLVVVVKQMMEITGVTDNLAQLISSYRDMTPLFNADDGGISISTFAMQLVRVTNVLGLVFIYIVVNNLLAKDKLKYNFWYIGIVVLASVLMLFVAGRTSFVQYIFAATALFVLLYRRYYGKIRFSKKTKIILGVCGISMLALFYLVMPLIGRSQVSSMPSYVSYYFGNSIASFQKAMDENLLSQSEFFGEKSLPGVQQALNKIGLNNDYSAYQDVWVHYWGDTGNLMASNTFTGMEPYYVDGGVVGVIVCQVIFGAVFTYLYFVVKRGKSAFLLILYGFVFINIFDQMRAESMLSLLSISTILYVIYIYIVVKLLIPGERLPFSKKKRVKERLMVEDATNG